MTRAELLLLIYRGIDEAIREHFSTIDEWPCGPGCSRCCEENLFLITSLEFKVIQKHLQTWNTYHLSRLQERVKRAIIRLQRNHQQLVRLIVSLDANRHLLSKANHTELFKTYDSLCQAVKDVPCPFLHHNKCSIYECRPIVCRTYGKTFEFAKEQGIIKYNVCTKLSNDHAKSCLLDGTHLGIEISLIRYNRDLFPLPVWLAKAMPDLTSIPNEWREFKDDVLSLDEFRLLQRHLRRDLQADTCDPVDLEAAEQIISRLTNKP